MAEPLTLLQQRKRDLPRSSYLPLISQLYEVLIVRPDVKTKKMNGKGNFEGPKHFPPKGDYEYFFNQMPAVC